jgi:hypothetical protein
MALLTVYPVRPTTPRFRDPRARARPVCLDADRVEMRRRLQPRGHPDVGGRVVVIEAERVAAHRKDAAMWQAHNRRRWELERDVLQLDERMPFVCECPSPECLHPVELTALEYEAAHMCDDWAAVTPHHILPDAPTPVLMRHPHFWVICRDA